MLANLRNRTVDALHILKDAGLVAASAAAQVGGSARVIDLAGDPVGTSTPPTAGMTVAPETMGCAIIDITAIEVATGDELYTLIIEGCDVADFSTGSPQIEPLAMLAVGAGAVIPGAGATSTSTGRVLLPFTNWKQNKAYRYIRMYTVVAGTIATGINYTARLAQLS